MFKKVIFLNLIAIFILSFCLTAAASHLEMSGGKYYTLLDEKNNIIHQTALGVHAGDIYITADNSRYKVVDVNDSIAHCIYQGKEVMPELNNNQGNKVSFVSPKSVPAAAKKEQPTIAVYHTHSDESYVPSDGKESIRGDGGIYDVGEVFVKKLKEMGYDVQYSENRHDPHDANAYTRSRKTVATLLKKNPDAIIDVHRDAVPPDVYQTEVKGEDVTKVKLVVGRQNPNMKTNMEFAKHIKAAMDKKEPGLSNGIYVGKGDYNQDLSPHAILIEVGAHTNTKEDAKEGVSLFAEVLPTVLGGGEGPQPAKKPLEDSKQNSAAGTTILIVILVIMAGVGGFYLLNKGVGQK